MGQPLAAAWQGVDWPVSGTGISPRAVANRSSQASDNSSPTTASTPTESDRPHPDTFHSPTDAPLFSRCILYFATAFGSPITPVSWLRITPRPDTDNMANEQISLPYFVGVLVFAGLVIRYLFFTGSSSQPTTRSPEAFLRSREVAVERIQQMFPQTDRRSILWDLQRNGGNIQGTTERILAGRLEMVSTV